MFNRFLVAVDGSDTGSAAVAFASDAARQFDGTLKVVHVTESLNDSGVRSGVNQSNRALPRQRVVEEIADQAARYEADVIVLGLQRKRVAGHRYTRGIQQRLTRVSSLPVLIAPGTQA